MGSGEGRLYLVFCWSAGEETEGLGLGEQRERRQAVGSRPGFLAGPIIMYSSLYPS